MLNWLKSRLGLTQGKPQRVVIERDEHDVSRKHISRNALKVIYRLLDHNYEAYLVGGGVRDLLLGGRPKDFDVATSATPEQVKKLFGNARIIGRRFKIVHVRFGREIIEVTTFRGDHEGKAKSDSGMLLRDNVYGTLEDDAIRRDLTINALYYNPKTFAITDYTGGIHDIDDGVVRIIGDAEKRYREDPVRILRVLRFAAKLDFDVETHTARPIGRLAYLLEDVSSSRLFDEMLKLFMSGHAVPMWQLLCEYQLIDTLFPELDQHLDNEHYSQFIELAMASTDRRIKADKPVTPAFIFAALLWPMVETRINAATSTGTPIADAFNQAVNDTLGVQLKRISIPKRFTLVMREIWELQGRMANRVGKRAHRIIEQGRFRAAYDFLILREEAGLDLGGLGEWYTKFQFADDETRDNMVAELPKPKGTRGRRRRPRKKPNGDK